MREYIRKNNVFFLVLIFIIPILIIEFLNGNINAGNEFLELIKSFFQRMNIYVFNLAIYLIIFFIFSIIFNKHKFIAYIFATAIILSLGVANFYKQQVLNLPLFLKDLQITRNNGEASNVAEFTSAANLNIGILGALLICLIILGIIAKYSFVVPQKRNRYEIIAMSLILVSVFSVYNTLNVKAKSEMRNMFGINTSINPNIAYASNGLLFSLVDLNVNNNIPEISYSEAIKTLLNLPQEQTPTIANYQSEKIDIINIMGEGNFDIQEIYSDLTYSTEVQPNMKKMKNKVVASGLLNVDTFGNGTGIAEFGFLTGISNKVFDQPFIEYESILSPKQPSTSLKVKNTLSDFNVNAYHAYTKLFYNREEVYQKMGFDKFDADTEIRNKLNLPPLNGTNYLRDSQFFPYIKSELDQNTNKNNYYFAVTMQNHAPYSTDGITDSVIVTQKGNNYSYDNINNISKISTHLHDIDKSLGSLIDSIEKSGRKTILTFFGDHQPTIENKLSSIDKKESAFKTQYMVWTNITDLKLNGNNMSTPELGLKVSKLIGITDDNTKALSNFYKYLKDQNIKYYELDNYLNTNENTKIVQAYKAIVYNNYYGKGYNDFDTAIEKKLQN